MTTLFGSPWVFPDAQPALESPISFGGVAVDRGGTIYIGDCENGMVHRVDGQGRVVVHAGNGRFENTGEGGPARNAGLFYPCGVSTDRKRNVYIAAGQQIRRVNAGGYIQSLNGFDNCASSPDGTPAAQARLAYPSPPAFDSRGLPYFIEGAVGCGGAMRIRMFDEKNILRTVAGSGVVGFFGDNGPALQAQFRFNGDGSGLAFDQSDNLYISDTDNYVIRRVDRATGIIRTVAGIPGSRAGDAPLGDGGPALQGRFNHPFGLSLDTAGNLYIADFGRVRRYSPSTLILTTVAGNGGRGFSGDGAAATSATLEVVRSVAVDPTNNDLLIASGRRIRRVRNGLIATIAGNDRFRFGGDDGPATFAQFNSPGCLFYDARRDATYICDVGNSRIRRVDAGGNIKTVAGTPDAIYPPQNGALALESNFQSASSTVVDSGGNIFAADVNAVRIHRIDAATGRVSIIASFADVGIPMSLAIDSQDNLYITSSNHKIFRRTPGGQLTVFAGSGVQGFSGDNGDPLSARLNNPVAVAVDPQGRVFIGDEGNFRIRVVENNIIRTYAGKGVEGSSGDGGPALEATFSSFAGLASDGTGNLYVSDIKAMNIRKISAGTVTRIAGTAAYRYEGDGGPSTQAGLNYPAGIAVNSRGELLIADRGNHVVRAILPARPAFGVQPRQLLFVAVNGESADAQTLTVNGGPTPFHVTAQVSGGSWLGIGPPVATTQAYFFVTVNNRALGPGTYTGQVTVTASNAVPSTVRIPVTLLVLPKADLILSGLGDADLRAPGGVIRRGATSRGRKSTTLVEVKNGGPDVAKNNTVRPERPAELESVQVETAGLNCTPEENDLYCPEVTVGQTGYIAITGTVANNVATGAVIRPAASASTEIRETDLSNNRAEGNLTVVDTPPPTVQLTTQVIAGSGSIRAIPTPDFGSYYQNEQIVLEAVPGPGCQFSGWRGAVAGGTNPMLLTMDSSKSVQASFLCPGPGLRFVPLAPCRVLETRAPYAGTTWTGPHGPPMLAAGQTRTLPIAGAVRCGIPASAKAFALNVTLDTLENNTGPVDFVTVWPSGQTRPDFWTARTSTGGYVANAAIVRAGNGGAVDIFSSGNVHMVMDINGYFTDDPGISGLVYYPHGPCRAVDTRTAYTTLAPPYGNSRMQAGEKRTFRLSSSPGCGTLPAASAYSLQVTLVPGAETNGERVSYLTIFPNGEAQPTISNLNSVFGHVVSNSAIVASTGGAVDIYVPDATNVIVDVTGYFAPDDGTNRGLFFYPVTQCRVANTQDASFTGAYGAPQLTTATDRVIPIAGSTRCSGLPVSAKAWALNAAVMPNGSGMPFLSMWPAGAPWPNISQINAFQGQLVANSGIVPSGPEGAIQVKVAGTTHAAIEVAGYFSR